MFEQDIHTLQKTFKDIIGFRAPAEISEEAAKQSAGIIIELEEKFLLGHSYPSDLFLATIATSQLLQWCDQLQQHVTGGSIPSIEDKERLKEVNAKLSQGNWSKDEIKRLLRMQYVADPKLGANKAMDLLVRLHTFYGGFRSEVPPDA